MARPLATSTTMLTQQGACRTLYSPRSLSLQTREEGEVAEAPVEAEMIVWEDTTRCPEEVTPAALVVLLSVTPPMYTSLVITLGELLGSESIPLSQFRSQGQSRLAQRQISK